MPVAQIVPKVSTGKGGAKEMHPLEASRALKRVSAHIQMADVAGLPGVRMVADGAWVRMDIATNKEQCQDKETPKGSRPVVTGQRAAPQKNSSRQWGRPFDRAHREICPAISTHPHWGGDCTTTMRWQDVGADEKVSCSKWYYIKKVSCSKLQGVEPNLNPNRKPE